MRQGLSDLITRGNPALTTSNPYDMVPMKDAPTDAVEARSSTATGPGFAPQLSLGSNVPLAPVHTHRDARGMFSTRDTCVHPECCTRTEPEKDAPPFPVPDGFSLIPNDQGGWLVVPSTVARGAAIAPALPLFPIASRADRSFESEAGFPAELGSSGYPLKFS